MLDSLSIAKKRELLEPLSHSRKIMHICSFTGGVNKLDLCLLCGYGCPKSKTPPDRRKRRRTTPNTSKSGKRGKSTARGLGERRTDRGPTVFGSFFDITMGLE